MSKKKKMTYEERRLQILENASLVFSEYGLDGARTRYIAEACGINEALIYKYFSTKDELFIESITHLHDKIVSNWQSIVQRSRNKLEAVRNIYSAQIFISFANPQRAANMMHGAVTSTREPRMRDLNADWFMHAHQFIEDLISQAVKEGSAKPDTDPFSVAVWVRSLTWYANMVVVHGLDNRIRRDAVLELFHNYLNGIATEPPVNISIQDNPAFQKAE